jgi:hypothetical protein
MGGRFLTGNNGAKGSKSPPGAYYVLTSTHGWITVSS